MGKHCCATCKNSVPVAKKDIPLCTDLADNCDQIASTCGEEAWQPTMISDCAQTCDKCELHFQMLEKKLAAAAA
uniref:ShKT domain-containing protein n=1 Tax=Meloidogyne enterolobii TaxID=390850 RepID=A0A6V7Y556_MELEN|nr:unnamed protein product [Meloidogyne enterolobii]